MKSYTRAAFYFIAHADDWQLFMAPEISIDIADETCKVIIVHTTAGDAGKDQAYWRAREIASIESLHFRISATGQPLLRNEEIKQISDRAYAFVYSINNCGMYFLRLPDGNYDGSGFLTYDHQGLGRFNQGQHDTFISVDGQSVYVSWNELTAAIDTIIVKELPPGVESVSINLPETDTDRNLRTHNDHYYTGLLIQSTLAFHRYETRAFVDYALIHEKNDLDGEELFWKIGMFTAYHQSMYRDTQHSTIAEDPNFIPWCFRNSSWRSITATVNEKLGV